MQSTCKLAELLAALLLPLGIAYRYVRMHNA
jgi:hypothetical protein